jgi:hypothetical protein
MVAVLGMAGCATDKGFYRRVRHKKTEAGAAGELRAGSIQAAFDKLSAAQIRDEDGQRNASILLLPSE